MPPGLCLGGGCDLCLSSCLCNARPSFGWQWDASQLLAPYGFVCSAKAYGFEVRQGCTRGEHQGLRRAPHGVVKHWQCGGRLQRAQRQAEPRSGYRRCFHQSRRDATQRLARSLPLAAQLLPVAAEGVLDELARMHVAQVDRQVEQRAALTDGVGEGELGGLRRVEGGQSRKRGQTSPP